jgi:thiol-disulfide isomerase/thioredoxin
MWHITGLNNALDFGRRRWTGVLVLALLMAGGCRTAPAATLEARYPGLATGFLRSAVLAPLADDTLLEADGLVITQPQLQAGIQEHEPKLQAQLQQNLLFVLEQEATRLILLQEAQKAGIPATEGDDDRVIQALFQSRANGLTVAESEARAFYAANKEMVGSAPFEQVADGIRQYLLQEKRQQAISAYIEDLGDSVDLRINQKWVAAQNRISADNPLEQARRSGKPTLAEFGATGCVPCDMMQPILDGLRKDYPDRLNVVFVHVGEDQVLAARYGIRSIPVQFFFDAEGREVFRHVGFFARDDVNRQLAKMGVAK